MRIPSYATGAALVVALGLVGAACGSASTDTSAAESAPTGAEQAAASNLEGLATSDDVRLIEVLDVGSGGVTTLADAVDGDRPVLIWFWAPH